MYSEREKTSDDLNDKEWRIASLERNQRILFVLPILILALVAGAIAMLAPGMGSIFEEMLPGGKNAMPGATHITIGYAPVLLAIIGVVTILGCACSLGNRYIIANIGYVVSLICLACLSILMLLGLIVPLVKVVQGISGQ